MKNRVISIIIMSLFFIQAISPAFAAVEGSSIESYRYDNYYILNDNLMSDSTTPVLANLQTVTIVNGKFRIQGRIDGNILNINGVIDKDNIILKNKYSNWMEILSVSYVDQTLEIVLKSANSMYIIRKNNLDLNSNKNFSYNRFWYNDFIKGTYKETSGMMLKSYTTNYDIPITRSFSIYGDQYTEKLVLNCTYDWPYDIYQPADFNTVLWIKEMSTTINYLNGGSKVLSGCSLKAVGGKAHFAADAGEYFESMKQEFIAKQMGQIKVVFGFWLGIPKTPFGLTTVYQQAGISASTLGSQSFHQQNSQGSNKCKNASAYFDPYAIHMTEVGHYLKATVRVQNDSASNLLGRKYLKVRWDYTVVSSGNNNGVAAPSYNYSSNYTNTLYYYEH